MFPLSMKIELSQLLLIPEERRRPAQTQRLLELEEEYKEQLKRRRGQDARTVQTD